MLLRLTRIAALAALLLPSVALAQTYVTGNEVHTGYLRVRTPTNGSDAAPMSYADAINTTLGSYITALQATAPTAGQKAALAGSSGTPGAGNTYVTDADSRNTNARTPTAHATSHQNGGSDEIATATPAANAIPKATSSGKLTAGWVPDMIGDSGSGGAHGLVPAPASGDAAAGKFLKADGTFAVPAGSTSGTVTSVSVTTANGVSGTVATSTTTPAITLALGAITPTSVAASGAVSGTNITSGGNVTGSSASTTGNAATATALATPRNINGVAFDGTAPITVAAAAGTLTGATLASGVTASSLTSFGSSIALGTPASGVATNLTGTAASLTAGNVTTNANLTGPITSVGNATSIASQTGTGTKFVVDTSPTIATPTVTGLLTETDSANGVSGFQGTSSSNGTSAAMGFTAINDGAARAFLRAYGSGYNAIAGLAGNAAFGATNNLVIFSDSQLTSGGTSHSVQIRVGGTDASQERFRLSTTGLQLLPQFTITAGGTADTGLEFSSTAHFGHFFGSGAPTLSAAQGSIYQRSDGGANTGFYLNTTGSTTWVPLISGSSPALTTPDLGTPSALVCTNCSGTASALNIGGNAATATTASTATLASTVTVADAASDTTTFPMLAGSATGSLPPLTDSGLSYNASTDKLTATGFVGALTGNADTASAVAASAITGTTLASNVVTTSITALGTQAQALNMGTHLISSVTDPASAQDATTKNYVDPRFGPYVIGGDSHRVIVPALGYPGGGSLLTISQTIYCEYLGLTSASKVVKFVELQLVTVGSGTQVAEVAVASTPLAPNGAAQTMTVLASSGTMTALTTGGGGANSTVVKNTSSLAYTLASSINTWACSRYAFTSTPTQPTMQSSATDMGTGMILTATGQATALTSIGSFTASPVSGVAVTSPRMILTMD